MRVMHLHKRALSEGVSAATVEDAMDGADPKASLIGLIVEMVSTRGPADRMLAALRGAGKAAADTLSSVLDHAMDVLEQLSVSSPRKSRKSVLELMESVEELAETANEDWCDGMARCGSEKPKSLHRYGTMNGTASRVM